MSAASVPAPGDSAPPKPPGKKEDGLPQMHIKIYSPFKTYLDEQGYSISAENATGPFDILPHHHNFMTLLKACELQVRTPTTLRKIRISGGLMHVKADRVIVFLDI